MAFKTGSLCIIAALASILGTPSTLAEDKPQNWSAVGTTIVPFVIAIDKEQY